MAIKYLIGHWTAGAYYPSEYEKSHYQELVDLNGKIYSGTPQGKTSSTGGMNSITYNITCCAGMDKTPVKPIQMESFCKLVALKLKHFGLTAEKFYTHAEIGEMTRNYLTLEKGGSLQCADCRAKLITELLPWNSYLPQNVSKVDLRKLPDKTGKTIAMSAQVSGDYLRNKIRWYYSKLT